MSNGRTFRGYALRTVRAKLQNTPVKDHPPSADEIAKADKRRMDCVDCHNRPTHIYIPPDLSIDRAMAIKTIDPTLPFIKQQGVEVLIADYKTLADAQKAIPEKINAFYQDKYPQIASSKPKAVKAAISRAAKDLRYYFLPGDEGELADRPQQRRPFLFDRLFPLPRWQSRQLIGPSHQQGLQLLPFGSCPEGRQRADVCHCRSVLQTSNRPRRLDRGELR